MLRLWEGSVRRALSEPSIGSITTRVLAAVAEADLAALLGDGDEGGALRGQLLELGEDRVLAAAVDHQACGRRPRRPPRRRCAPRSRAPRRRSARCAATDAAADSQPVCGENVHRRGLYGALALGDADLTPPTASARSPWQNGPLLLVGAAGTGQDRGARAAARAGSPPTGTGPERVLVIASTRADRAAPARARRGAARRPLRGALDRHLGRDRRAAPARALRGGRPRPLLRRPRPGRAAGDAARPPRRAAAAPATRSAATRPGLLARLLARIDALKAGSDPAEPELAELYAAHDRILAEAGSLDRGDVFLILNCLLDERPDVRAAIAARFAHADGRRAGGDDRRPSGRCSRRSPRTTRTSSTRWSDGGADDRGRLVPRASTRDGDVDRPRAALPRARSCASGAAPTSARRRRRWRARSSTCSPRHRRRRRSASWSTTRPREGGAGRGGDGGARHPLPPLRAGGALPAARGARRDRLAAGARRPGRLGRRRRGR